MSGAGPETLGKYEIRGTLGRGAMGVVYDAWDPVIARRVAIKTIRLPDSDDAEAQDLFARFRREAQAAGRLSHPNIVGVFDYAESNGIAYIVMEFVEGHTLKSVLDANERMAVPDVVRVMREVLDGLAFSHARGVIHRDIKPANILLTAEGHAKIADFGIARVDSTSLTQVGTVMGTPAYMSPEQFMGQAVDARTDIYSSGVLLYQLLTGERPFDGSPTAIMHKVLHTTPPKPSALSVTVPRSLDAVTERAMARRPEDRYATAPDFAGALSHWADSPVETPSAALGDDAEATVIQTVISSAAMPGPVVAPPAAAQGAPIATPMPPPATGKPAKGGRGVLIVAAVAGLLVLAGGGAFWMLSDRGSAPHAPPSAERIAPPPARTQAGTPVAAPAPSAPPPPTPPAATAAAPAPPPASVTAPAAQPALPTLAPAAGGTAVATNQIPTPAALRAKLAQAMAPLPCLLANANVAEPPGGVTVSGLVGDGDPDTALRAAVNSALGPGPAAQQVDWRMQTFDSKGYCLALDIVRPATGHGTAAGGVAFSIALPQGATRLATNDLLKLTASMPGIGTWLQIDYLQSDGRVWHMIPSSDEPARLFPADTHVVIGEPRKGFGGWAISAPYGRDMIVAVASSQPLFAKKRPPEEDTAAYLAALKSAIGMALDHHEPVFADAIVIDTIDRP